MKKVQIENICTMKPLSSTHKNMRSKLIVLEPDACPIVCLNLKGKAIFRIFYTFLNDFKVNGPQNYGWFPGWSHLLTTRNVISCWWFYLWQKLQQFCKQNIVMPKYWIVWCSLASNSSKSWCITVSVEFSVFVRNDCFS